MILDNEAQLVSGVPFDLDTVRPGPGQPICLYAADVGASLVVTTGETDADVSTGLITVRAQETVEFALPSTTDRYIQATFATGSVSVVLDSQTNK